LPESQVNAFCTDRQGTGLLSRALAPYMEDQMAQPAWKRPGSPIGKKGPRKTNPKYKRRSRQPWSDKEVKQLRSLAKANTPTGVISLKMERPPASIASKVQREGISLTPANRSPYNRRTAKKARR
jgi:hypothetical protein